MSVFKPKLDKYAFSNHLYICKLPQVGLRRRCCKGWIHWSKSLWWQYFRITIISEVDIESGSTTFLDISSVPKVVHCKLCHTCGTLCRGLKKHTDIRSTITTNSLSRSLYPIKSGSHLLHPVVCHQSMLGPSAVL